MSELIPTLIAATGLSRRDILTVISNAPRRYATFPIPKRSGGERIISQPARELKALQRALVEAYLSELPVHQAATAYRKGFSIRDNVLPHSANNPILKFDFRNFFPSISPGDWDRYCTDRGLFHDALERHQATQILFHAPKGTSRMGLAIGAPSSPHLSNLLMFEFDALISNLVAKDYVTYTRYADDLTFSAKRTGYLVNVEKALRRAIAEVRWPRNLWINEEKTVLATKRYHRQVTGLVLSNDGSISIGHDRKRKLRAAVHWAAQGKLSTQELAKLSGMLAFVHAVEPAFLDRLVAKYGIAVIDNIKKAPMEIETE
jgi:hypothetical protein